MTPPSERPRTTSAPRSERALSPDLLADRARGRPARSVGRVTRTARGCYRAVWADEEHRRRILAALTPAQDGRRDGTPEPRRPPAPAGTRRRLWVRRRSAHDPCCALEAHLAEGFEYAFDAMVFRMMRSVLARGYAVWGTRPKPPLTRPLANDWRLAPARHRHRPRRVRKPRRHRPRRTQAHRMHNRDRPVAHPRLRPQP